MSWADPGVAKSKLGVVYPMGCTGFVADVMGVAQKHSSKWKKGEKVEESDLSSGDVIGWDGHVLIYYGPSQYLNCPGPNQAVKMNKNMGH